jgi:muconolactone delta-isomerase
MMKILALEREKPGLSSASFTPHLKDEAQRAWELYRQGVFRELYFDERQHTAVIIIESDSIGSAQAVLATLPLVQAGLIEFEIISLVPYDGFERLFENKK